MPTKARYLADLLNASGELDSTGAVEAIQDQISTLFAAIAVLFVLPWLDSSKVKSMRYRPVAKQFFFGFVAVCLLLGWCGASNPDDPIISMGSDKLVIEYTTVAGVEGRELFEDYDAAIEFKAEQAAQGAVVSISVAKAAAFRFIHLAQILTVYYFAYFLVILPLLGLREQPKGEPEAIHKAVLGHQDGASAVPAE